MCKLVLVNAMCLKYRLVCTYRYELAAAATRTERQAEERNAECRELIIPRSLEITPDQRS